VSCDKLGPIKGENVETRLLIPRKSIFVLRMVPLEIAAFEDEFIAHVNVLNYSKLAVKIYIGFGRPRGL